MSKSDETWLWYIGGAFVLYYIYQHYISPAVPVAPPAAAQPGTPAAAGQPVSSPTAMGYYRGSWS